MTTADQLAAALKRYASSPDITFPHPDGHNLIFYSGRLAKEALAAYEAEKIKIDADAQYKHQLEYKTMTELLPNEIFIDTDLSDNLYSLKNKEHRTKYTRAIVKTDGLVQALENYYIPQLKFSMKQHREFAFEHKENEISSSLHHGAANAFETAIGCIEEALSEHQKGGNDDFGK